MHDWSQAVTTIKWSLYNKQSLLERIEGLDESRISDIINDIDVLANIAPYATF